LVTENKTGILIGHDNFMPTKRNKNKNKYTPCRDR